MTEALATEESIPWATKKDRTAVNEAMKSYNTEVS